MPKTFVSYSHDDRYLAETMADDLRASGVQAWIDVDGLTGGDVWERTIEEVIAEVDALVVIVTPNALKSEWVPKEIAMARTHDTRIVPLIMARFDDVPATLAALMIADLQAVDFTVLGREEGLKRLLRAVPGAEGLPPILETKTPHIIITQHVEHGSAKGVVINYGVPEDPEDAASRQRAYLWRWFNAHWAYVPLADIADRDERVSLLDVYVPLPVDFGLTVKTKDKQITDWWVGREKPPEPEAMGEGAGRERQPQPRQWADLGVGEAELQQIVDALGNKIIQRDYDDGDHYWYMEAHDAASVRSRFVLVGDPGSGKSSFVRHLTLCLAGELLREAGAENVPESASLAALRDWLLGAYTPIYIELRDLVARAFPSLPERDEPLKLPAFDHFWAYVQQHILGDTLAAYAPDLLRQLESGQAIILLDGLDEVPDAGNDQRRAQVKALVAALERFRKARIIITSRHHAYEKGGWALPGYGRCELRPLDTRRLRELAQALFRQIMPAQAEAEAQAFFEALDKVPDDLRRSPLFFTLLAAIWLDSPGENRLPTARGALYRQALDLMLAKWSVRKGVSLSVTDLLGLKPEQLRLVLENIACTVHEAGTGDTTEFHRDLLVNAVLDIDNDLRPGRVWQHLEQRAGILISGRDKHFRFSHRSFQEHLAACWLTTADRIRLQRRSKEDCFPRGVTRRLLAKPDLWRNVALLAADELVHEGRSADLWRLLPEMFRPYLRDGSSPERIQAALAALEIGGEHRLYEGEHDSYSPEGAVLTGLRDTGTALLTDLALPPAQRAETGRKLAVIGDLRPGVGVIVRDGIKLPDIAWGELVLPGVYPIGLASEEDNPARQFELTYSYRIAKYPITYVQFQTFLDDPEGYRDKDRWFAGLAADDDGRKMRDQSFKYANHPRETVNWYQALAFCRWLSWRLGGGCDLDDIGAWAVRLPTEQEWEIAARGTDGREYPYEGGFDAAKGNTGETGIGQTSAVGIFPNGASPYGIHDLSGNVWEWCLTAYGKPAPDAAKENLRSSAARVLRGGSWSYSHDLARAAYRGWGLPDGGDGHPGFRVVWGGPFAFDH